MSSALALLSPARGPQFHAARVAALLNTTALTRPEPVEFALIPFHPPKKRENDQLVVAARAICLASKDNRLATLICETERLSAVVYEGRLDRQAVVDRLMQAANAYGLVENYGLDYIESKITEALDSSEFVAADDRTIVEGDAADTRFQGQRLSVKCAADVKPEPVSWLWPDRFAFGKLTLIAGEPGIGKSQITAFIAAAVSNGAAWPNQEGQSPVGRVLMFSAEDDDADTTRPRLDAAGADVQNIFFAGVVEKHGDDSALGFDLTKHVAFLEHEIEARSINVAILDPFNAFLGTIKSHEAAQVRAALLPLTEMAARKRVAIIGVMHLNKAVGGRNALHRVVGSGAFTAVARSVYAVARERDSDRVLFVPAKSNLGRAEIKGLAFRIVERTTASAIKAPAIVWEPGEVVETADEIFAPADSTDEGRGARAEAEDFLLEALRDGPVESEILSRDADEVGISPSTLKRAKRSLGVKATKSTFGSGGKWACSLATSKGVNPA
jgi:putative DNA primase/helicase